jgi:hypothetical protein
MDIASIKKLVCAKTLSLTLCILLTGCGDSFLLPGSSSGGGGSQGELNQDYLNELSAAVATMSIASNILYYDTTPIATMSNNTPVVSPYGEYVRGRIINTLNINGIEFLVYGNNGAIATECTPSLEHPEYGPTNDFCTTASVQAFDKFVVCAPRVDGFSLTFAQEWPGAEFTQTPGKGLVCWTNGVPEKSDRMFTF